MASSSSEKVRQILASVLRQPVNALPAGAAIDLTPGWDSLAQLDILAAVEQEFGVTIEPEQAIDLTSLPALVAFLDRHAG